MREVRPRRWNLDACPIKLPVGKRGEGNLRRGIRMQQKPRLFREPSAWAKRKLALKLNDLLSGIGLRVLDRVDFRSMKISSDFAHILDVGVADGTPDLYERFPDAFLDLFEPSPMHIEKLKSGVLSKRSGNIHPVALGASNGEATLYLTGRTGSSLIQSRRKRTEEIEQVTVPVRRLDSIINVKDIRRPSLLKIDTEGYELDVLRGVESLLPAIDCVVVEVHFDKPDIYAPGSVFELLSNHGFEVADVLDHHIRDRHVVCADIVFERRQNA